MISNVSVNVNGNYFDLENVSDSTYEAQLSAPFFDTLLEVMAVDDNDNVSTENVVVLVNNIWIAPKTNWLPTDFFNIEDWNRLLKNIYCLHALALDMYSFISLPDVPFEKSYVDLPYADEFNAIEDFVEQINMSTYKLNIGDKPTFYPNQPTIDAVEMNRLETAMLRLYTQLMSQKDAQYKLAFRLGNEKINV